MERVAKIDNLVAHGQLKGSIMKQKTLSSARLYGLGYFGLASFAYMKMASLSMMMGPVAPTVGIVSLAVMGIRNFTERETISQIDYIMEGEHAGLIRCKVQTSPFISRNVVVNPKFTRSICALGEDDIGADDTEANIMHAAEYLDESTGVAMQNGFFNIPADAFRDKITMEWILAHKDENSETDALFNQQIMQRHMEFASTGGITGLSKIEAEMTGFANYGGEDFINAQITANPEETDIVIRNM